MLFAPTPGMGFHMTRTVKHGGTIHLSGSVVYGGSVDELNKLLREKDDCIDILRLEIIGLREHIEELEADAEWNEHSK
jgi:hypothetical protein